MTDRVINTTQKIMAMNRARWLEDILFVANVERDQTYERVGDMDTGERIRITLRGDDSVALSVVTYRNERFPEAIVFKSEENDGLSPNVYEALQPLIASVSYDNEQKPIPDA